MKKFICALVVCCAAVWITACSCRNDFTAEYTLNAVVMGVEDTEDGVMVEIAPVGMVAYNQYGALLEELDSDGNYGYIRYKGKGEYYIPFRWYAKSQNILTYRLGRTGDADSLLKWIPSNRSNEERIIKFTVAEEGIVHFEDTCCVFSREDLRNQIVYDSDLTYYGE